MASLIYMKPRLIGLHLLRYLRSWWATLHLGAIALVMVVSPSTYGRAQRRATACYIYGSTWQVLPWFTMLAAVVSLVIIRIVVVTAFSYGLSRYALEMVVRVLVLELIPLSAALFVALRASMSFDASDYGLTQRSASVAKLRQLRTDLAPLVIAHAFAVLSLAMVTSCTVLVLAYVNLYGLSPWGLLDYTRTVGRVFDPVVTAGFLIKTVLFGMAVAVIPIAAMLDLQRHPRPVSSTVQPGAVRLLFVLLLIEAGSLALKYI